MFARLSLALVFVVCAAAPASAQQWSAEEQEVWQNVEAYWDLIAKEDVDEFMTYMDDDFLGWARGQWVPTTKNDRLVSLRHNLATTENVWYTLKPVGIKVHGDVAIAHYFFTSTDRDADGDEVTTTGYWTDILMKQGDKWVMIGDAGGAVSDD